MRGWMRTCSLDRKLFKKQSPPQRIWDELKSVQKIGQLQHVALEVDLQGNLYPLTLSPRTANQ